MTQVSIRDFIKIPNNLTNIHYNSRIIPNGKQKKIELTGANCQVFAYEILRINGLIIPDYRSSELWEDNEYSQEITSDFQPLDLLFFNDSSLGWGAHVGIYIGKQQVLHNSIQVGKPAVWSLQSFKDDHNYNHLLGAKRFFHQEKSHTNNI